jgi:hypothetical protein
MLEITVAVEISLDPLAQDARRRAPQRILGERVEARGIELGRDLAVDDALARRDLRLSQRGRESGFAAGV